LADVFNIEPTAMIYLHDKLLNTFHNLRVNGFYQAYLNEGEIANRFVIHIKAGVLVSSVGESCSGSDGLVHLTNNSGTFWNYTLYNAADSLVSEASNFSGNAIYQNLKGGEYKISFSSVEGNYDVDQFVQVGISNKVKAEMHASITQTKPGQDVTFTSLAENATGYFWDFADGMMLAGEAIVQHSFETEGVYQVVMRAHKNECSDTASAFIYVSNEETVGFESVFNDQTVLKLFPNPARDQAQWTVKSNDRIELLETELVDLKGQTIKKYQFKNVMPGDLLTIDINEVATGMYYVVSRSAQYKAVGKLQVVK
jgi:plastocyanin